MSRKNRDICFAGADKENRHPEDFYPTDPRAVDALLQVEKFEGSIWEPACGDGAISKVLVAAGYDVISTDLHDRGYGTPGVDFLADNTTQARNIITNPPYCLDDEFVKHALNRVQGGKIAMLFRSVWIQAQKREELRRRLSRIWACRGRLRIWRGGIDTGGSSPIDYSWFVWDPAHVGPTVTDWLPLAPVPRRPPRKRLVIKPEPIGSTLVMGRPMLRVIDGGASGPDLQAVATLRAKLWKEAGYRPVAIYSHDSGVEDAGKRPIGDDWGERALRDPPEAAVAPAQRIAANTGILARGLQPIDLDLDSPDQAEQVHTLSHKMLVL